MGAVNIQLCFCSLHDTLTWVNIQCRLYLGTGIVCNWSKTNTGGSRWAELKI